MTHAYHSNSGTPPTVKTVGGVPQKTDFELVPVQDRFALRSSFCDYALNLSDFTHGQARGVLAIKRSL